MSKRSPVVATSSSAGPGESSQITRRLFLAGSAALLPAACGAHRPGAMVVPPSHAGTRLVGVDDKYVYMTDTEAKVYRFFKTP